MIRVMLVDDHVVVREGLKRLLDDIEGIDVVAEASHGDEALRRAPAERPDVLLLDVSMPGGGNRILDLIRQLRSQAPQTQVLLLSMHAEGPLAIRALRAGAAGYVTKTSPPGELVTAIYRVFQGRKYLSQPLAESLAEAVGPDEPGDPLTLLSEREFQVLCMLGAGRAIKEIAAELALSPKTVSTYRSRIAVKLRLDSTADLIRFAIEHDLKPLDP